MSLCFVLWWEQLNTWHEIYPFSKPLTTQYLTVDDRRYVIQQVSGTDSSCITITFYTLNSTPHISSYYALIGEGNGSPLKYSCLANPMDRGSWYAAVHWVAKSWTRLSDFTFTFMHWRRKWQPTPVFLPGESQGQGSLVGCRLWGCTESDTTEATWH